MNHNRKSRKFHNSINLTGEALIRKHCDEVDNSVVNIIQMCMTDDCSRREDIRCRLTVASHLLEAEGDIACWASETMCNEIYERIGAWQKVIEDIKELHNIQHF